LAGQFLLSLGVLLAVSLALYGFGHGSVLAAVLTPVAPLRFAWWEFPSLGSVGWTCIGLSAAAALTVAAAFTWRRRWLVVVAHLFLGVYWLWALVVMGIGA
jgi:hypothetical protein